MRRRRNVNDTLMKKWMPCWWQSDVKWIRHWWYFRETLMGTDVESNENVTTQKRYWFAPRLSIRVCKYCNPATILVDIQHISKSNTARFILATIERTKDRGMIPPSTKQQFTHYSCKRHSRPNKQEMIREAVHLWNQRQTSQHDKNKSKTIQVLPAASNASDPAQMTVLLKPGPTQHQTLLKHIKHITHVRTKLCMQRPTHRIDLHRLHHLGASHCWRY